MADGFVVAAGHNGYGQCDVSAWRLDDVDQVPPSEPTALIALDTPADQGGSIDLSWAPATDRVGVTGYRVYRVTSYYGDWGTPTTLGDVTAYTDTTASTGKRYLYAVTAVDAAGNESPVSVAAATAFDNLTPATPSGLAAVGGRKQISLSWSANTEADLSGYDLYRDGVKVNTTPIAVTSYTDTGRADATTYSYRLSAVDTNTNASAQCATVSATTLSTPPQPSGFDGTFESGADGSSLTPAWTLSGTPQRAEYDSLRAKNGALSGWIQGPTTAAAAGASLPAVMTSNGAEYRFWMYTDTATENRYVTDTGSVFELRTDTTGKLLVYTKRAATGYTANAYTAVGTYAVGWAEYRIVLDFSGDTYTLFKRASATDAWTPLKSATAPTTPSPCVRPPTAPPRPTSCSAATPTQTSGSTTCAIRTPGSSTGRRPTPPPRPYPRM